MSLAHMTHNKTLGEMLWVKNVADKYIDRAIRYETNIGLDDLMVRVRSEMALERDEDFDLSEREIERILAANLEDAFPPEGRWVYD